MAKFVAWSDDLSVGIEEIDVQHQVLVRLINEMHEAIHQRHGSDFLNAGAKSKLKKKGWTARLWHGIRG